MEISTDERKGFFMGLRVVMIVLAAFLFIKGVGELKAIRYIGSSSDTAATITVQGSGEVFAVADVAEITYSVETQGATVAEAQTSVTKKISSSLAALREKGVLDKDIRTENYSSYPVYEYDRALCTTASCPPTKAPKIVGYTVSQTVVVKVRDTNRTGEILQVLGDNKVTSISGPNFTIDDPDALSAEARKKAIADAETKAKALAKDLGVTLVRITSFQESNGSLPQYYAMVKADSASGAPVPELPKGENKISSSVTITYEIK
jgi:uncharacterized protein YggE